jgi:L-ascorbate metabolism protein UlaG (beta-lactamase superfamily)
MTPRHPLLKLLVLFSLISQTLAPAHAGELTARWLGVAGLSISDGETTLLFDPVFTKPSWRHWLFGSPFRSDPEKVKSGLAAAGVRTAHAVFSSHCHFDHASDIGAVSGLTGAIVRGGPSLKRISMTDPGERARFEEMEDQEEFRVGKFRVIPFRRQHAAIIHWLDFKFLPGPVPEDFRFGFYQFHEGEVWAFRIEHPDGSLLIDQGSHFFEPHARFAQKTDAYFVGIANKKSLDDLVENNIGRIRAPLVVPLHFDFFLFEGETIEAWRLPGNQISEIQERVQNGSTRATTFHIPVRNEPIRIRKKI